MRIWLKIVLIWLVSLTIGGWGVPGLAAAEAGEGQDAAVTQAIEHRLEVAPGVPSYLITVKVNNGVVTLSGAVDDLLARNRAGLVAETVSGVRTVDNHLKVVPTDRSAADLRRGVAEALAAAPALSDDRIYPDVQDGFVTLTGTVDSWPERHLAELMTEGVQGVKGVDNKLRVAYALHRSDADLKADIQSRIRWDPWLSAPEIRVAVSDGEARLAGLVESASARDRAYRDAWVNGVKGVDASGVGIVPNVRVATNDAGMTQGAALSATGHLTDAALQAAIAKAVQEDPLLKSDQIKVRVEDGVATLRGEVPSSEARKVAQWIARDFVSAGQVRNLITVQASQTS
jgi:osmotically-inducible protein OsmY